MGLAAPRYVGFSQTRSRTRVPCTGRWILNHCITEEATEVGFWSEWSNLWKKRSSFCRDEQNLKNLISKFRSQPLLWACWLSCHLHLYFYACICAICFILNALPPVDSCSSFKSWFIISFLKPSGTDPTWVGTRSPRLSGHFSDTPSQPSHSLCSSCCLVSLLDHGCLKVRLSSLFPYS